MKRKTTAILFSIMGMMILILDSKTALQGAYGGIELCIKTVIPSLFPFFVLSILLTSSLSGSEIHFLRPLSNLCGIPSGAESILITGFLGGYPVGAQCIAQSWKSGQLSKKEAHRMLGFCSNAGPAFLFGMTGALFEAPLITWSLWMIQILSAILVAVILPGRSHGRITAEHAAPISIAKALTRAVSVMAGVCGWVVMFRVMLSIGEKRIFYMLPTEIMVILTGFLELTNGCVLLNGIGSDGIRYVLCSMFLAFGGICVAMQTASVTAELGTGMYFPGKLLQCTIAGSLACIISPLLFSAQHDAIYALCGGLGIISCAIFLNFINFRKNNSRNTALQRV